MAISVGIIVKCDDPLVVSQIDNFLRFLDGAKIIYFTRSEDKKLYVIDSDRLKNVGGGNGQQNTF